MVIHLLELLLSGLTAVLSVATADDDRIFREMTVIENLSPKFNNDTENIQYVSIYKTGTPGILRNIQINRNS